jgi:phosphoglycerate dehydrogenase-like enzyme
VKLLIASPIYEKAIDRLREKHDVVCAFNASEEVLKQHIPDREVLIFRSGVNISAEVLKCGPEMQLLIRAGSGLDNLDLEYVEQHDINLIRIPEPGAQAVAELGFALMLALARQIVVADSSLRQGQWTKHELSGYLLSGKTLGVYGAGSIGSTIGRMGAAWNMNVVGCVKHRSEERSDQFAKQGIRLATASEVLAQADFLTINVPLNEENRYLFGAEAFSSMKQGAFLINLARGGIVNERELQKALATGHLGGAALDVHEKEGAGKISPLAEYTNVILTPHIGAMTIDSQKAIGERVIELLATGV